jgi:hypothetical protein
MKSQETRTEDKAAGKKDYDPAAAVFLVILLAPLIGAIVLVASSSIYILIESMFITLQSGKLINELSSDPGLILIGSAIGYIFTAIPSIVTCLVAASIISRRGRVSILETMLLSILAVLIFALQLSIMDCRRNLSASCMIKVAKLWPMLSYGIALTLVTALILRFLLIRWKVMRPMV